MRTQRHGVCFFISMALLLVAVAMPFALVQADTVSINESQKDALKCDKAKNCYQVFTGSYAVTVKLSKATTSTLLGSLLQGSADEIKKTPLQVTLGVFSFAESLSTAAKGQAKITKTSLQGAWRKSHVACSKYNTAGVCKQSKIVTDGAVKISLNAKTGGLITLSGKSAAENGQKIYADQCRDSGLGNSSLSDNLVVTVGGGAASAVVQVACKVKKTIKHVKTIPFELISITAAAKLAQPTLPFTYKPAVIVKPFSEFYVIADPIGYPEYVGFQEFSELGEGFVSLSLKDSFDKADAKTKSADIDFVYYLLGNSTAVFTNSSAFNQSFGLASEKLDKYDLGWKKYSEFPVFFNAYSTNFYADANGGALYYSLSDEEFDNLQTYDQINALSNHSIQNGHAQTSQELRISYDGGRDKTHSQSQIFGVTAGRSNYSFTCFIKVLPDISIYALRMQVKCAHS